MSKMIAEIGGDASGLEKTFEKMDHMAEHFSHHFSQHLSKAFGIGFLATAGVKMIEQVFGRPEELEKMAKQWGKNTDEIQYLEKAAEEAHMTFSEFMEDSIKNARNLGDVIEEVKKRGVNIIPQETIDAMAKDKEAINSFGSFVRDEVVTEVGGALRAAGELAKGNLGKAIGVAWDTTLPGRIQPRPESPEDHSGYGSGYTGPGSAPYINHRADREVNLVRKGIALQGIEMALEHQMRLLKDHKGGGIWTPEGFVKGHGIAGVTPRETVLERHLNLLHEDMKKNTAAIEKLRRGEGG